MHRLLHWKVKKIWIRRYGFTAGPRSLLPHWDSVLEEFRRVQVSTSHFMKLVQNLLQCQDCRACVCMSLPLTCPLQQMSVKTVSPGGNFFSLSPAPPQNWICSIFAFYISQPTVKHHTELITYTHTVRFVYLSWEELSLKTLKNRENNKTNTATIEWHYGKCRTEWFCCLNHTEEPGAFAVVLPPLCFKSLLNCSSSPGTSIRSMATTLWHRGKRLDYFFALGRFSDYTEFCFYSSETINDQKWRRPTFLCSALITQIVFCRDLTGNRWPQYRQRAKRAVIVHLGF